MGIRVVAHLVALFHELLDDALRFVALFELPTDHEEGCRDAELREHLLESRQGAAQDGVPQLSRGLSEPVDLIVCGQRVEIDADGTELFHRLNLFTCSRYSMTLIT